MLKFRVSGMSCAACSGRVKTAVSSLDGIRLCEVNLLTGTMTVEGGTEAEIIAAVRRAGYDAALDSGAFGKDGINKQISKERKALLKRLVSSAIILIPLMYLSMGHVMWGFPLPAFLEKSPFAIASIQMVLSLAVLLINSKFFINGTKGVINRAPNMDTLVSLGSGVSFIFSLVLTVKMAFLSHGAAHELLHELYFESAAMILVLITLGKALEARAKGKTTDAIQALISLTPKTATVIVDGVEMVVPTSQIKPGDVFVIRAGESIPADGVVIEGESSVNESALTGESMPEDKTVGSFVYAATINTTGFIVCKATKAADETVMAGIVKMVSDAAASKAPIATVADKVSGIFVPVVLVISLLTFGGWSIITSDVAYALARGISVLVISCPCALGLATPVAIMVGSGIGARLGVLFKDATALELTGRARTVVFDKTGTVTKGEMSVTDFIPTASKEELSKIAYSLEKRSEHPLARAVVDYIEKTGEEALPTKGFEVLLGSGVFGVIDGEDCYGGSHKFISGKIEMPKEATAEYHRLSEEGKTPLYFTKGGRLVGIIAVADSLKEDAVWAITALKKMGVKTVMLTGDNEKTARRIGSAVGVDEIIAEVMPDEKEREIARLKSEGRVIMVGDGINDAPALSAADVGVAIGSGTDIAIESADVVITGSGLSGVVSAVRLGRETLKTVYENLFWAFIYNIIGIPLAAGVFIPIFSLELDPMFGAAAMSLSSISVVMNALRLNLKRQRISARDALVNSEINNESNENKETEKMEITLKVEGMMCPHCEARVKTTLEAVAGVVSAEVSHKTGLAVVTAEPAVTREQLSSVVEAAGYKITE